MDERQQRIAEKFVAVEEKLAALYASCSAHYVRDMALWEELEEEERMHARMARRFLDAAGRGALLFRDPSAQEALLDNLLADVGEIQAAVRDGKVQADGALKLALDIESSLVEREAFRHYVGGDDATRRTLTELNTHTLRHGEKLRLRLP